MKNFGKANSASIIATVAKANQEKANTVVCIMIENKHLHDYPKNNEDISYTEDIETSIQQLGFTDPIEVTNFDMEDGEYTILSGHRRRAAGVKQDMTTFPCIVRTFTSAAEVYNYVLMANSQRDSAKDPLLYCKRYKMHEQYLAETNFSGDIRREIAKRLGVSVQQADRYKTFTKIILPVWDMVRAETVGMSSVLPMASHSPEEQEEILLILKDCITQGKELTRETCSFAIKGYRSGQKTYAEIFEPAIPETAQPPIPENMEQREQNENQNPQGNGQNAPQPPIPQNEGNNSREAEHPQEASEKHEQPPAPPKSAGQKEHSELQNPQGDGQDKPEKTEEEKEREKSLQLGAEIPKLIGDLERILNNLYEFPDQQAAEVTMKTMGSFATLLIDEISEIGMQYKKADSFKQIIEKITNSLGQY